jgi:hypothetical protein
MTLPRPSEHLIATGKLYPDTWKQFDVFRAGRGVDLPNWPDWCYCPMAAAYAIVSGGGDNRVSARMIADVARLSALAAWRVTQGVYRFDPALYSAIIGTSLDGDLPTEVLYRMPEWCVYIETPDMLWHGKRLYGFFAHLEWDAATHGREELRLLLDSEDDLQPLPIHLGKWTLLESVENAMKTGLMHGGDAGLSDSARELAEFNHTGLNQLLSLLLYLCTENAEIGDGAHRPSIPVAQKTKKGPRIFPPDKLTRWDVGVRIGSALRRAYQAEQTGQQTHAGPRPHIRRAHWHTYKVGVGRELTTLKWLPPIPVNLDDPDILPTTIKPVKSR